MIMFQQFKNIDTAFRFVRLFALILILAATVISVYTVHRCTAALQQGQQRIYVLYNGKLLDAQAVNRRDSLAVEIRDHVKMFHYYFYSLEPDEQVNTHNITAAMYLADSTAFIEYRNLQERGYYSGIIAGNISQHVMDYDSILVDVTHAPYQFWYYGKLRDARPTSVLTKSIVTEGYVRTTDISDKNPHGFQIEGWKIIDSRDLKFEKR
jgi:conjugative transposon TraK protein